MRPWWHQLKGKSFEAELAVIFWHILKALVHFMQKHLMTTIKEQHRCHNHLISAADFPWTTSIRWSVSAGRRGEGTQGDGFLPQIQSGAPHPPVLLLHQLGDSNRILNESMRHAFQRRRLHSPIKAAQHSLNTPSNDPPWTRENCTLASSIFDKTLSFCND